MRTHPSHFQDRLIHNATLVQAELQSLLQTAVQTDEIARPSQLLSAMQHGVLNGGKRLRPFLVLETAAMLGGDLAAALRVGASLECVHCYSLVHDDLPAMDDDALRRGQPTVHIAYDEATAILAGDSLLTLGFDILAAPETRLDAERKLALVLALSRASGVGGMAGGQALDLQAERIAPDEQGIMTLQAMKTGALIRYACEAGAILSGSSPEEQGVLRRYGETIGLAFQLADDLLDLTADAATMGKATGKDSARGKGTLVSVHGIDWARDRLDQLVDEASTILSPYGARADILLATARFIADRKQ